MSQADHVLHVLIDPLVSAEDAALIASVPPELLPPPEGPVPDRPKWAGRPPKRREQGDSYRWLCYRDGYRAAARHRGGYRVVKKPVLWRELEPYQESLDRLTAAMIHDEVARATVRDEVWALTQLLWSYAELTAKVTVLERQADNIDAGPLSSVPAQPLDAARNAIADRISRLEYYVQTVQAAEQAELDAVEQEERRTVLQPLLHDQAVQYGDQALDLLAQASVGSLAPNLPAPSPKVRAPATAQPPAHDLRHRADDLVERIQALGADAPAELAAAARHLNAWLEDQPEPPTEFRPAIEVDRAPT
ncbi:hypothetical protein AB0941_31790 [Streptomyces sp. NPDC013433]|uniref:hypothetical protein n=1 Tax=Streptomyces sp. NPDC013433 TaxID=3155604 RepID=UPI0034571A0B